MSLLEKKVLNEIIEKTRKDESFKAELIANPKKTLENYLGKALDLPEGKTLIVNDQGDGSVVHINIPTKPNFEDVELTDDQLEAAAGGLLLSCICVYDDDGKQIL